MPQVQVLNLVLQSPLPCSGATSCARPWIWRRFFEVLCASSLLTKKDAHHAGEVRADLERIGKPIGAYDVLLAGQALRYGLTLVTANTRKFASVKGLRGHDWAKASWSTQYWIHAAS